MWNYKITPLRMWCHKILPLVYDESLSYYEVLCKTVAKLNEVIEVTNGISDVIDEKVKEYLESDEFKNLVRTFILSLEDAISTSNEGNSDYASRNYEKDELVWINDILYLVTTPISAGSMFIVNTNIRPISVEELLNNFITEIENSYSSFTNKIKKSITDLDEGENTHADQAIQSGKWLWLNDILYKAIKDIDFNEPFVVDYNIEEITVEDDTRAIYIPALKKLVIHGKIDNRVIVNADYHVYHPDTSTIEIREVE